MLAALVAPGSFGSRRASSLARLADIATIVYKPPDSYTGERTADEQYANIAITVVALFIFGYVKGQFTGSKPLKSAIQTCLIGSIAAAVAFFVARLIGTV